MGFFTNAQPNEKLLSAADWEKLRVENLDSPDYIVIDVRTPEEYSDDGIPGAINIDFYNSAFKKNIEALDYSKNYLIYCRSGARSANARDILNTLGLNSVYDLDGGMIAYSELK